MEIICPFRNLRVALVQVEAAFSQIEQAANFPGRLFAETGPLLAEETAKFSQQPLFPVVSTPSIASDNATFPYSWDKYFESDSEADQSAQDSSRISAHADNENEENGFHEPATNNA